MDKRVLAVLAVVACALAAVLVFAMMPTNKPIQTVKPMPSVTAAAEGAEGPGPAAAGSGATPVPTTPGQRVRLPTNDVETKVDVPEGAKIEEGGLAFGQAVCQHIDSCGCQKRTARACATAYSFISKDTYGTAKCLVDLPCEEMCESLANPGKTTSACARGVNELVAAQFRNRGK